MGDGGKFQIVMAAMAVRLGGWLSLERVWWSPVSPVSKGGDGESSGQAGR